MWTVAKLKQNIEIENLKLVKLNSDRESYAAQSQWTVVNGIKQEIARIQIRVKAFRDVLEADE